jgi:outer membrane receptor for ferrienterochelin and colicins
MRLKLNYGHSYVAPSAPQLYKDWYGMGGKYHIIGNKDLKPELSDSYEIALEGEKGRFNGRIAYFYNDVTDLIDSVYSHDEGPKTKVSIYQNIGKAEIQGVELEAGFRITDDLTFKAAYSYLDAMDKDTDERLEQRAKNKIIAKLYYTNPRYDFDVNLWGEHTMDYLEDEKNYDFTLLNLNVKKRLSKRIDIYVGVDNLLDEKEEDLHDKLLGTMVYAGVNLSF